MKDKYGNKMTKADFYTLLGQAESFGVAKQKREQRDGQKNPDTTHLKELPPCVHLDVTQTFDLGCKCKAFKCNIHAIGITKGRAGTVGKHCSICPDYIQQMPEKPDKELNVVIGVTTCPIMERVLDKSGRYHTTTNNIVGHRHTLPKTLQSILDAGWSQDQVVIFAEPGSIVPDGWRVVRREKRFTPFWNIYHGMKQLLEEFPDVDGQMWVEDDTWFTSNAKRELRGFPSDKCGMLQVFRMSGRGTGVSGGWISADSICEKRRSDGYQKIKKGEYIWGSNAIIIPQEVCRFITSIEPGTGLSDSPDVKLSGILNQAGYELWCCNPSLAQTDHTLPSTAGHNLSPKMTSDTYTDTNTITRIPKKKYELSKINIVYPKDGWILEKIAHRLYHELQAYPYHTTLSTKPKKTYTNLYINYDLWYSLGRHNTFCNVGYFTHRRDRMFDIISKHVDWCVGASQNTSKLLPQHKTTTIEIPPVDDYYTSRKPIFGVCSQNMPHKNIGWISQLNKLGFDVRYTGGSLTNEELKTWYEEIDYLLIISSIEGIPIPFFEALGLHKPIIAPNVGLCWNYPCIRYDGTFSGLVQLLKKTQPPTWKDCAAQFVDALISAVDTKNRTNIPIGNRYAQLDDIIMELQPEVIVEIGTNMGERALQMIREAFKYKSKVKYIGYDLFEDMTPEISVSEFNGKGSTTIAAVTKKLQTLQTKYPLFEFELIKGNTKDTAKEIRGDLVFIDGGHSIETIEHDLMSIEDATVILMDDFYEKDEYKRIPDISQFGCNHVLTKHNIKYETLPVAGRVSTGGLVRIIRIDK